MTGISNGRSTLSATPAGIPLGCATDHVVFPSQPGAAMASPSGPRRIATNPYGMCVLIPQGSQRRGSGHFSEPLLDGMRVLGVMRSSIFPPSPAGIPLGCVTDRAGFPAQPGAAMASPSGPRLIATIPTGCAS